MSAPAPSSSPKPTAAQAKAWLPLYLKRADSTIARLQRILATTGGLDSVLCCTYYSLTLVASQLELATNLLSLSSSASAPGKQALLIERKRRMKAMASLCSDVRMFMRLSGLLGMYRWAVSTYSNPPKDPVLRTIAWSQVMVNTCYQVIENSVYLAQHTIIPMSAESQKWCWLNSTRLWMTHTMLDFVRLARTRQLANAAKAKGAANKDALTEKTELETWWRQLYVNSAYAPLTVHWSVEGGLVTETWVGICGCVAGFLGFKERWRQAQE